MPLQYQWDKTQPVPRLTSHDVPVRSYAVYRIILECLIQCPGRTAATERVAEALGLPAPWVLERLQELRADGLLRPIYGRGWKLKRDALVGGPYGDLLDVIDKR